MFEGMSMLSKKSVLECNTYPIVPDGDGVRFPSEAYLEIRVVRDLMEEELEDCVRLRLRDTNNATSKSCYYKSDNIVRQCPESDLRG